MVELETFTVRRVAYGVGVENFPVHAPMVEKLK